MMSTGTIMIVLFVEMTQTLIYWVLKLMELWLSVALHLTNSFREDPQVGTPDRPTVVIVGCNFAGLAAMHTLLKEADKLRIILIDQRDYFEYTPGMLRVFCDPDHYDMVARKIPRSRHYTFIHAKVTSVCDETASGLDRKALLYQAVKVASNGSTTIKVEPTALKYDFLILATGSTYPAPVWPTANEWTLSKRRFGWKETHEKLKKVQTVAILGAGAVGVELAAEILDHFPSKMVTVVDAELTLLRLFPPAVGKYAYKWLKHRGARFVLGKKLQSWTESSYRFLDGTVVNVDIVYNCFGGRPNSGMMKDDSGTSHIAVNSTLRLSECPVSDGSIFAVGDVASPPTGREKQALQAESQGHIAADNIIKTILKGSSTQSHYPRDLMSSGTETMPFVAALSLGRYDGVVVFNGISLPGPLAAVFKWLLEFIKVMDMEGHPLGSLLWAVAEKTVLIISSSVVKPNIQIQKV